MPSISTLSAPGHTGFPFMLPDTTHSTVPSVHANENMMGRSIPPPDILHHRRTPFLLLPHGDEQSQSTFSDVGSATAQSVHEERTCDTIDHLHALRGDLGLLVQDTVARGQFGLFHIPDGPENASTLPIRGRPSAAVALRNRIFALGDNSTAGPRADELATGDVLPRKAETQGLSPMLELDGRVREADHVLGGTLEGCAKPDPISLNPNPRDIRMYRDEQSSKAKACTTTH